MPLTGTEVSTVERFALPRPAADTRPRVTSAIAWPESGIADDAHEEAESCGAS